MTHYNVIRKVIYGITLFFFLSHFNAIAQECSFPNQTNPGGEPAFSICFDPILIRRDNADVLVGTKLWLRTDENFDYPDPPFPSNSTSPSWKVFWEHGDGTYTSFPFIDTLSSDAQNRVLRSITDHTYFYNGDYKIRARSVPIKSSGEEPPRPQRNHLNPILIRGQKNKDQNQLSSEAPSNFDDSLGTTPPIINLDFHLDRLREDDPLTAVVMYRNPASTEEIFQGKVYFDIPEGTEILDKRFYSLNTTSIVDKDDIEDRPYEGEIRIEWPVNLVPGEEHAVFFDLLPSCEACPDIDPQPPIIRGIEPNTFKEGEELTLRILADDPNALEMTFSAQGLPQGLDIPDSKRPVIRGTPIMNNRLIVTLNATNSIGFLGKHDFILDIEEDGETWKFIPTTPISQPGISSLPEGSADEIQLVFTAKLEPNNTSSLNLRDLLIGFLEVFIGKRGPSGFEKFSAGGSLNNTQITNLDQFLTVNRTIGYNFARDPNFVEVFPKTIYKGEQETKFTFRVHFQNSGGGEASVVKVSPYIDSKLNLSTLAHSDYSPKNVKFNTAIKWFCMEHNREKIAGGCLPSDTSCIPLPYRGKPQYIHNEHPCWILSDECTGISGVLDGLSEDPSQIRTSEGYIEYTIQTDSNHKFKVGEKIRAFADVYMNNDSLRTDPNFYVEVVRRPFRIKIPNGFSVKGGLDQFTSRKNIYETLEKSTIDNNEGWHAGIGYRVRVPNIIPRRLRIARSYNGLFYFLYKSIYFQTELLVNRNRFLQIPAPIVSDVGDYKSWAIEAPLSVRFVPDLVGYRVLAFSGGYRPSIFFSSNFISEGQEEKVAYEDFSSRFQHAYFIDMAAGNILGRYGLSCGFRYSDYFKSDSPINLEGTKTYQLYLNFNL